MLMQVTRCLSFSRQSLAAHLTCRFLGLHPDDDGTKQQSSALTAYNCNRWDSRVTASEVSRGDPAGVTPAKISPPCPAFPAPPAALAPVQSESTPPLFAKAGADYRAFMSESVFGVRALLQSLMSRARNSSHSSGSSWASEDYYYDSPHARSASRLLRAALFKHPKAASFDNNASSSARKEPARLDSGYVDGEGDESIDYLATIPTEITLRILKFLGPVELTQKVSRLSRYLHMLANDEYLWKAICNMRWADKKHIKLQLHPRADYSSVLHSLDILSDAEIHQILRARHVPEDEVSEATNRAKLERLLRNSVPDRCEDVGCAGGKWKSSYMAAEFDSTRTEITEEELLEFEWTYVASSSWSYDEDNRSSTVKFWKRTGHKGREIRERGPIDGSNWPQVRMWELIPGEGPQGMFGLQTRSCFGIQCPS